MTGDLLGLRPRVLGRREYLPHVLNERLQRVRCCLSHFLSLLCSVFLNRPTLLRCTGQGVKKMYGPPQGSDPNTIPARIIFLAGLLSIHGAPSSHTRVLPMAGGPGCRCAPVSLRHPVLASLSSPSNRSCSDSPGAAGGCRRSKYAVAKARRYSSAGRRPQKLSGGICVRWASRAWRWIALYGRTSRATVAVSGPAPRARCLSRWRPPTSKPAAWNAGRKVSH